MKKIIALAVASAFAVPALAADVSLSGDVEYVINNTDGVTSGSIGDKDITVSATEEMDGITVTATLVYENSTATGTESGGGTIAANQFAPDAASTLSIGGSFGTLYVGDDVGSAVGSFDEITDKAEQGGGGSDAGGDLTSKSVGVKYAVPTGVDGLALHVGMEMGGSTTEETSTSFGVQYTFGPATVFYGSDDADDAEQISAYGVSVTQGPVYVAYETISNLSGVAASDHTGLAVVYNYGMGNITYETNETKGTGAAEQNAISISYKLGPVNTYVASHNDGAGSEDTTSVGVEYAF